MGSQSNTMPRFIHIFLSLIAIINFVEAKINIKKLAQKKDIKVIKKDIKLIKKTLGVDKLDNLRSNVSIYEQDPNDWRSFINVANYHASPDMCKDDWDLAYPLGDGTRPCCVHGNSIPLFAPWHRLYMVQFESSWNSVSGQSLSLPYWDWTQLTDTPSGLPELAVNYAEWQNGPIKGGGITHRNPGTYFKNPTHIQTLRNEVKHSFCQELYINYDITNQKPHGKVHTRVGGSMAKVETAAYDPIFYLHHSFIDFQFAYWQELQTYRLQSEIAPVGADREMPPFSNITNPAGINVNPIPVTKAFDTQRLSLHYKTNFKYEYDNLIFDGKTPLEFHNEFDIHCLKQNQLGFVVKDFKISSTNKIFAVYSGSDYEVNVYYTLPMIVDPILGIHHTSNVQEFFDDNEISFEESRAVHYQVVSDDGSGNEIASNLYKPTNEYFDENRIRTIRFHVNYFDQYCHEIRVYEAVVILEFLNNNGSFATGVTSDGDPIVSPYYLTETQTLTYEGYSITIIL